MSIKVPTPTKGQTWAGVAIIALPIIASVLGVEYGQKNPPTQNTVKVDVTALPAGAMRSDQDIKAMCKEITKAAMNAHIGSIRH